MYHHADGQFHGRSFETNDCAACRNDALQQKMAHYRVESLLGTKPTMQRQRPIEGDDIEAADAEQVSR